MAHTVKSGSHLEKKMRQTVKNGSRLKKLTSCGGHSVKNGSHTKKMNYTFKNGSHREMGHIWK